RLLERVLQIATNAGDVVLDCFGGSGTTAAVAHKRGAAGSQSRRSRPQWIPSTRPRLEKVLRGEDAGGISEAVGWEKGGGFRQLEVGPSMYDVQDGRALLAGG
ncbi:MAG: DNA methyltransferase, partial [Geodermatophilaceae bacterium]